MKKALIFLVLLTAGTLISAQQKHALVIGNGNYTGISRLNNPVNDANDMEAALRDLGFTVEKVLNGELEQIENAVLNLRRRLSGSRNSYGFFFFAGHGVQSSGENFLIPVTADNIRTETQLRNRAVSLQFILDSLSEAGNELNMIVLDACRDNPFSWARSGSRGLSVASRTPSGTIVMYAAGAGQQASDGTGRNGLFTSHLLTNIKTQGLSVFDVFDRTMTAVLNTTNGIQHPELSIRAGGANTIFLGSRTQQAAQQTQTLQQQPVLSNKFLQELDAIKKSGPGNYTITLTEDISINNITGIYLSGFENKTITLQGDSQRRTITNDSQNNLIFIPSNVTLILGSNITLNGNSRVYTVVHIAGGRLEMLNGSIISGGNSGSYSTSCGGGVYIRNDGVFNMRGGYINNNNCYGIVGSDGGVFIDKGTFNMSGGTISNNKAQNNGGGVYISEGAFNMSGGTISNNSANLGGGVFIYEGTLIKTGGTIDATNRANRDGNVVNSRNIKRNTTAGPSVNLDNRVSGRRGGWE